MQRMSNGMKNMRVALLMLLTTLSFGLSAQNVTITGNITDVTGEPIIGASVMEKGTTNGTITDFDGNFTLNASGDIPLVISYIGMKQVEVDVKGKTTVNVILEDDTQALEEVVVIGYGTVKRKDITGSVASVSADQIAAVPVASAAEAIAGKLAGVQVTTTEGSPDAEMKIRVRGGGSITGDNTPLFIVDGFPVASISDIPPSDIESIDVLKDASSTAIYGSRGANGVIIITTKSGKEGKVSINYNAYVSWKKIAKKLDVMGTGDYARWQYELALLKNSDKPDSYEKYFGSYDDIDLYDGLEANDWQDQVFGRTGFTFNHNLSITGGSDKTKYAFSYSHMDDKAIMQMSNYKRDNISLKLNNKPTKAVTLDFSLRYAKTIINGGGANEVNERSSSDSRLKNAMIYSPIPVSNIENTSDDDEIGNLYHPLTAISDTDRKQVRQTINMAGSFSWEIIKNLKFKSEVGYDVYNNEDSRFYGLTTYYSRTLGGGSPAAMFTDSDRQTIRNTNTLNYDFKKLLKNKKHNLNMLLGQEYILEKSRTNTTYMHGYNSTFTSEEAFKLTTQAAPNSVNRFFNADDILFSVFARANYDYESKYLLSGTFRADGSSKFESTNRWGFFPSVAAAWRISSESFMDKTESWLDDLKLRLSYGTAGNNAIPSNQTKYIFSSSTTDYVNDQNSYWTTSSYMPNPDLKWETTITRNLGIDYTILNGRINGTFEFYLNDTKDLLIEFPVPGSGYNAQYRNMGKTENKGFEASINVDILNKKNYGLNVSANIGFNKNKIKSLGDMEDFTATSNWNSEIGSDFLVSVGGSVGEMYGYVADGRYEVSDFDLDKSSGNDWVLKEGVADASTVVGAIRPGTMKLKRTYYGDDEEVDEAGNYKITENDKTIIGNANPLHTGGFTINGRIYNFDISANFNWSYGNDIYNANKIEYTSTSKYQMHNMLTIMGEGNRWTNLLPDGTISNDPEQLAAMNANTTLWSPNTSSYTFTSWAVEDGSFLRLNTLTIGYTLPKSLLAKARIQNLRFYATGYNLFCWTNYSGFDPEVSTRRRTALTPGVDYSAYPKSRQFVIGVNLNF